MPRKCICRAFTHQPGPCPSCGETLHQATKPYLVATGPNDDTYVMSSDMGWFCANCPTVVIDESRAKEMLQSPMVGWDVGTEFRIMGLVDLDAVPPEQRHLALHEIDPFPLVPFEDAPSRRRTPRSTQPSKRKRVKRTKARRKPPRRKKRRR